MSFEFTAENQKKFKEYLTHYPQKKAAILPTLWLVQDQLGYVSLEAMEYIAPLLEISPAHVYEVCSFYTMFHREPVGKYHIQLCRTLSCALNGSEDLLSFITEKLKIKDGEKTQNGKFSLETVECLASCGTAPMLMINEKYYENLTPHKVDELLNKLE